MTNLLVVDDEKDLLEGLSMVLSEFGYQVETAASGEEALALLQVTERPPALIIADVIMPGINGLQLLDAVRPQPQYMETPFLFISATLTVEMEKKFEVIENTRFMRKPFQIDRLFDTIEHLLNQS